MGFSQTILYQAESTTRTVQDPQTVVLAQGFHASGSVSNPFVAKIGPATENPGGGPTDSNAGANNPSGTTAPSGQYFHDTNGNIEVTGTGQLQYTLPVAVPPGVKGVAPQVNLVYNSGSGNGVAGYSWNISGLTSISRVGKNIEKDGEARSIQIDYSDYYSFNGQRLILKSGEYGKDGAEYVTEKYSNVKIKSLGSIPNWKQPEYWEVTFEDGSQAWYGGTAPGWNNATNRLNFNIVKWKDAQGNVINYSYAQADNVSLIKSITWGGNEVAGTSSFNEITFSYNDRSLIEGAYVNGPGTMFTQTKILKDILVKANGNQFKKYTIDYTSNGTAYQFVQKITEYNSLGEQATPVYFEYPQISDPVVNGIVTDNQTPFNNVKFTGDFNADSYLDFVMNDGSIKLGAFNEYFNVVQTNKVFNSNAIVVNSIVDEDGKVFNGNGIVEYVNGKIAGYVFKNNTFTKIFEKQVYDTSDCNTFDPSHTCSYSATLYEGDIEGDGISNILLSLNRNDCYLEIITDPNEGLPPGGSTCYDSHVGDFIVDLKNQNNPVATYILDAGINESSYTNQKYMDIDGDGKVDIINVSNTNYTIFEFVKTAPNEYLKKIKFSGSLEDVKGNEYPVLFGDFNGDGKIDFTLPITEGKVGKDDWKFYMGTGKSFNTFFKPDFLMYKNESTQNNGAWMRFSRTTYSISDLNADGKSDIVQVFAFSNLLSASTRTIGVTVNSVTSKGMNYYGGAIDFELQNIYTYPTPPTFPIVQPVDDLSIYQPITNVIRANNNYYNVFLFRKDNVLRIKAPTGIDEIKRIKSIVQGGITTQIDYKELDPVNNPGLYNGNNTLQYPYFEMKMLSQTYAISQLRQAGRKKDYRYRGFISHLQGRGSMGFRQTAQSSWYADGLENTKIWSGGEIDPLNEGVPSKEWSIRTNDENQIFPNDISENNTQLLNFKSINYKIDKLLNGQIVTTISDVDKPKIVKAIVPISTKSKNFLTNVITNTTVDYNNYYLPSVQVVDTNNSFSIAGTLFTYTDNPTGIGKDYYIGRLESKSESNFVSSYGSIVTSKEDYTYNNNLIKTIKKWNRDNTQYNLETYDYDNFGNVTKQIITNSVDSQAKTSSSEYDTKGRFVVKSTNNLGLETNSIYNDLGQILSQIDPLGNNTQKTYDGWGKILKSKNNLSGTTTYQYAKINGGNIKISELSPNGNQKVVYTNSWGQIYKVSVKSFKQILFSHVLTWYDVLGRKKQESEPYLLPLVDDLEPMDPIKWNTYTYNDNVYPAKVTYMLFNGKQTETSVSGLTTTIKETNPEDYGRTNTKSTDALGNVISTTDKGGTINFSYNAAGQQTQAKYAENIVTTKYDTWGRKSEFSDPSNGTYKYEYDGFGNIKKTVSPKGTKEYTYNNLGQLISQKEISTVDAALATNKLISFTYDNKGRIVSKSGTSKGKPYSANIVYDPQGRILSSSENSNDKYFIQKGITYDDKARIISYQKSLFSSGIMTKVDIENVYSDWNGELYQIKDKNSGKVLWQLNEINAKGQILSEKLGASDINNTYDANNFLSTVNHSSQVKPGILQLSYSFDALKNELKSRITGGDFNITESFDYDDNNRLINWTNPVTGIKPQTNRNVYDVKGRIMENDQVGTMKYENSSKIYQSTGMTLNAAGTQNYNNDLIQTIVYNENNDPVFIDGQKGDVAFQYGLLGMRQRVTYGGNFAADGDGKFTKFYNEDGSFEILKDNITGQEKHILYIGGNPYESNIIFIKNYTEANGSYKFLHKDYIGSILAISDEAGNKLEQRHFDAWGNFTHLKIGNGAIITDKNIIDTTPLLTDRGYTGHEHFAEVGIIHMNGRLYDPLLRRFLNADENIQDPYNTQNYNKYGYVMNNPLMFNDPSGEIIWFLGAAWAASHVFLATIITGAVIGAALGAGMYLLQAAVTKNWSWGGFAKSFLIGAVSGAAGGAVSGLFQAGSILGGAMSGMAGGATQGALSAVLNHTSANGIWQGALTGFLGGGAGMIGGGTFASNVAWGTGTGALVGGIGSLISGGSFADGAIVGAITGAAFAAVSSGVEMYKNYKDGYGFKTNTGVVKNLVSKANVNGTIDDAAAQKAIDYVTKKYGMKGAKFTYDSSETDYGVTDPITGDIAIGPAAFDSADFLKATTVHELGHSLLDRVLDTSGNFTDWAYPQGSFNSSNSTLSEDGPLGYAQEIYNAGRLNIGIKALLPKENPLLWTTWGLSKIFNLVPLRFGGNVVLKKY
ncbi:hypothetical protein GCM10022217_21220 [Chryseobacterium ginsenosidimutans]